MTDPTTYGAREAREDAAYDHAWKRAKALEAQWQRIKDAAIEIKAACEDLRAEDARCGIVHCGQKWQQVGTDTLGRPVFGKRPGLVSSDLDEIAASVAELDTIDVRVTMQNQIDAWAAEELEGGDL
jgi:hypothetical protein